MRTTIATATLILSLLGLRLTAAEPAAATTAAEQQFQQADLEVAIAHYKKVRMAILEMEFKLLAEDTGSEDPVAKDQKSQAIVKIFKLNQYAEEIRKKGIQNAAASNAREQ